ncbi:hypothetical protein TorRG33x02_331230, partial [Trema orientale]
VRDQTPDVLDPIETDYGNQQDKDEAAGVDEEQHLDDYVLSRDRARRQIKPTTRYARAELIAFALNVADTVEQNELASYKEAEKSIDWPKWEKAMQEEIDSL